MAQQGQIRLKSASDDQYNDKLHFESFSSYFLSQLDYVDFKHRIDTLIVVEFLCFAWIRAVFNDKIK